jgi:hypothetical protein
MLNGAVFELRSEVGQLQQSLVNFSEQVTGELQAIRALLDRDAAPLARRSVSADRGGALENSSSTTGPVDDSQATDDGLGDQLDSHEFQAPMIPLVFEWGPESDVHQSQEESQVLCKK